MTTSGAVLYRYELNTAYDAGENRHPQTVIRERFPDAHDFEPAPIGDCWLFRAARRDAPAYFVVVREDKPAPAHPGPWRWKEGAALTEDDLSLVDANGAVICSFGHSEDSWTTFEGTPPDEPARSLIAAAPEMEALLRRWPFPGKCTAMARDEMLRHNPPVIFGEQEWRDANPPQTTPCGKCDVCLVNALLARIDAARKAGG